jgi:hypothetical protein
MRSLAFVLVPASIGFASLALAQGEDAPTPDEPAPTEDAGAAPAPEAPPAPAPAPTPTPAPAPAPAPAAQPAPPQPAQPEAAPPPAYYDQSPGVVEPPPPGYAMQPPPPPEKPDNGFEMPAWSLRVDPFNWLLEGRLGIEAEIGLFKFMSFEVVPVFVANDKPPTFNLGGSSELYQESNGIGSMSGASADLGFWLDGRALRGYVIRVGITNYGYRYYTKDDAGEIDSLKHTERRAFFMFGSHSRWGAFTIAGGIGLGVELNKEERCFPDNSTSVSEATSSGCNKQMLLSLDRGTKDQLDLNGPLYPMYLMARFSLGIAFD